ncbi:MAG: hypothetical protein ED859_01160 [Desulfuromonadales bacterium]|nr:MAG: hypothetical protein ED859_01160 [Desulfuromonadales bacterium]
MEGAAVVRGGAVLVDGAVTLDGVQLDVPSQKLLVQGVSGTVPLSLDTTPGVPRRHREEGGFARGRYQQLLDELRNAAATGSTLRIGTVHLGPLELGETTLALRGGEGRVEIVSLRSSLHEGAILGRGFVATRGGLAYGSDILISDLSLRRFCDALPKIRGYVSGRLDGVVSLYGEGQGLDGLDGFVDLWARESDAERMLLSKEFLQRLAGKKLRGFFFRDDRPFDRGEVSAYLEEGYLTFTVLDFSHTNLLGVKDLSVSVAPVQNRIALDHLLGALKEAAARGKSVQGEEEPPPEHPPPPADFQWRD